MYRYRGYMYAPRARAAVFLRIARIPAEPGRRCDTQDTISRPVCGYNVWLFLKSAHPAAVCFLTPHPEHHTKLKIYMES